MRIIVKHVVCTVALVAFVINAAATALAAQNAGWTSWRMNRELNPVVTTSSKAAAPSWSFATGDGISSSPTVVGDTAYITSNDNSVYALDVQSGALRWKYTTGNDVMAAPIVYGDLVIASVGTQTPLVWDPPNFVAAGAGPSALVALNRSTGKPAWYFGLAGTGMPSPAVIDGLVIHHDGTGMVVALDARTGAFRWKRYVGAEAAMTAINDLGDGTFLTSGGMPNMVLRMRSHDGAILWTARLPANAGGVSDQPVASDGTRAFGAYLISNRDDAPTVEEGAPATMHAYGLSLADGRMLWETTLSTGPVPPRNEAAIPLVDDGRVVFGSAVAGEISALDATTGKIAWQTRVAGPVKGGLVATGGHVFFGDIKGYLWCLDERTGAVVGDEKTALRFNVGSPIAVGGSLVIGSVSGEVLATPLRGICEAKAAIPGA